MSKKGLLNIIVISTFLIAVSINIHIRSGKSPLKIKESELRSIMQEGESFKKKKEPFLYYEVYKNRRLIGYIFDTRDLAPDEKGYGGPIEVLAGIDKQGILLNLEVLRQNETPEYAGAITGKRFLGQFKGKSYHDEFAVGKDIEGITHATISSAAVARSVAIGLHKMQGVIHGGQVAGYRRKQTLTLCPDFYVTVFIVTFLLLAFYLKFTWLRYAGLMLSMVYFGFIKANFISMANLGNIFLWNLPAWRENLAWYVLMFSGILLSFLFRGFYCSYMCPFAGVQIFLKKMVKGNIEITPRLAVFLRRTRFVLLWFLLILIIALNNPNVANYEPFTTIFLRKGSLIAWSIALIILSLSLFHYRPFCRYFCAVGAFFDILSRWGGRVFSRDAKTG